MKKKLLGGMVSAAGAMILLSGVAGADHSHFVVIENPATGATTCQYIGAGQTGIADADHGGHHRIHDNVHTGTPGSDGHGTTVDKEANEASYDCDIVRQP